jgi:short-subunit dehydrogenase
VLSLSEALWLEGRERGVSVLALCPGATETRFFEAARMSGELFGKRATPEAVVESALRALGRNRGHVVHGLGNRLLVQSMRFSPRHLVVRIAASMARPRKAPPAATAAAR